MHPISRREWLGAAGFAAAGLAAPRLRADDKTPAPSDRLRVGLVGLGGRATANWGGVKAAGAEVVAICDVDTSARTKAARETFDKAAVYTDFRKMIEAKGLDAVVVSTPDHMHFHPARMALSEGLHVYCEKPLTHTVWEARTLAELAKKKKLVTQMGTQIHAGEQLPARGRADQGRGHRPGERGLRVGRQVVGRPGQAAGSAGRGARRARLGSVARGRRRSGRTRTDYVPRQNWRRFWDFGGGTLNDMACHYMDLPFWALDLRSADEGGGRGAGMKEEGAWTGWWCPTTSRPAATGRR